MFAHKACCQRLACCIIFWTLPLFITRAILVFSSQISGEDLDIKEALTQQRTLDFFVKEWTNAPIVDMTISAAGTCDEYATKRTWHGTQAYGYTEMVKKQKKKGGSRMVEVTRYANQLSPMVSSKFIDGTAICIKRSDQRLLETDREKCPAGKVPCRPRGLTICVTEGSEDLCPITDVQLVSQEEYIAANYAGYEVASLFDGAADLDWLLLFSRTQDRNPIG